MQNNKTMFNMFANVINRHMKLSALVLGLMGLPMLLSEASKIDQKLALL